MFNQVKKFIYEEDGMGTVEVIVIIAVLVATALIFKDMITGTVEEMWQRIFGNGAMDELDPT